MKTLSRWLAAGALLALASGAWGQESWTVNYGGMGSNYPIVSGDDVGGIYITKTAGPTVGSLAVPSTFIAYCVDAYSTIGVPASGVSTLAWYDPSISAMQPPTNITWELAGQLSAIYGIGANFNSTGINIGYAAVQNSPGAAITQVAMWNLLYGKDTFKFGDTTTLSGGGTITSDFWNGVVSDIIKYAQDPANARHDVYFLKRVPAGGYPGQMFIGGIGTPHSPGPVPEASSLLLLLPGLLPLGLLARKRIKA